MKPAFRTAGAVLAVLGLALAVFGWRGGDARLNASAQGLINDDRPSINAHNSPQAAIDPQRPEVMALADRIDSPKISCSVYRSVNGGVNWRPLDLPLPPGTENCFWPDVAFVPGGDMLVLFTSLGGRFNQPVSVWLQRFRDEAPVGPAVPVAGPNSFHARLATEGDRVVTTWVQAGPATANRPFGFAPEPNPLVVSISADGGRTFSAPARVSEPERLVTEPSIVTGPDGLVVLSVLDLNDDHFNYEAGHEAQGGEVPDGRWKVVTWTSRDGGATFGSPSVVTDQLVIPQRIYVDIGAPRPGLARDRKSGRLYATWESGVGSARDIFLASSDSDGARWSAPRPVAPRRGTQTLPTVAVAPDGRVDVAYYDRSNDRLDHMTEVALSSSWDEGRTFLTETVSPRRFDSRVGFGSLQGLPVLGTHLKVLPETDRAVVFWADTRRGTIDDGIQDLAVALVDVTPAGGVRWWMVALGLVLAGAGAVVATRRRPPPRTGPRRSGSG